jgi:hypothetical protein
MVHVRSKNGSHRLADPLVRCLAGIYQPPELRLAKALPDDLEAPAAGHHERREFGA